MSTEFQISDDFILPLFDEIFEVKERDFSIEYNPLGKGNQKLLMLVSSASEEFLENSELQLLNTIIDKGLRKNVDDVWIVNLNRFPKQDLEAIWDYFQPAQVIVWGCTEWVNKQQINLEIHRQGYVKGAEILVASSLTSYLSDNISKAKLWASLQRMFFN
ncbi:MAG: hypothetical protein CFE21_00640 [Bacteroidetes bacterium B1(2017)]|nr:MAG: hypothetical protein CFE21_00640 [Bacteroidetes bacterium B1(2017)]